MPRATSDNTYQIAFCVPEAWITRATVLATRRSRGGLDVTRTEILRAALKLGLAAMERKR